MSEIRSDENMSQIMAAIELMYGGSHELARTRLEFVWQQKEQELDAFHICVLSQFMADLQDDVRKELEWDLRALGAAAALSDERLQELHPSLSVAGFLPSLHLNVADAFFRAGDTESAKRSLDACVDLEPSLSSSPFDTLTRRGIRGLEARLALKGT